MNRMLKRKVEKSVLKFERLFAEEDFKKALLSCKILSTCFYLVRGSIDIKEVEITLNDIKLNYISGVISYCDYCLELESALDNIFKSSKCDNIVSDSDKDT